MGHIVGGHNQKWQQTTESDHQIISMAEGTRAPTTKRHSTRAKMLKIDNVEFASVRLLYATAARGWIRLPHSLIYLVVVVTWWISQGGSLCLFLPLRGKTANQGTFICFQWCRSGRLHSHNSAGIVVMKMTNLPHKFRGMFCAWGRFFDATSTTTDRLVVVVCDVNERIKQRLRESRANLGYKKNQQKLLNLIKLPLPNEENTRDCFQSELCPLKWYWTWFSDDGGDSLIATF